jgi:hypothetical protein
MNNNEKVLPSIKYGNVDVTQIAIITCMKNNIITIPKCPYLRETLFGEGSQSTIKINEKEYPNNCDIHIDMDTSNVYLDNYPFHLDKTKPKIIIFIICHYSEMNIIILDELRQKIYRNPDIRYFIVASRFSKTDKNDVELEDDIIFVNQWETYFNILNKTLKAMEYVNNVLKLEYDFLIRTNISTVINIPQLINELTILPKENISIGGNKMQINWTCPGYGIRDNRYRGRWFVQGTSIIFSKDVCEDIVKNQHKIEKSVVDDISLFMYLSTFNEVAYHSVNQYSVSFYECSENIEELHMIPKNIAFYRNKTENMRDEDITRIKYLCNQLITQQK